MGYSKQLCSVLRNEALTGDIYDMHLKPQADTGAQPGQFLTVLCGERPLRRPISICELLPDHAVRIVYQVRGAGTAWLSEVRAGDTVDVLMPLGHGFTIKEQTDVVFVGGGIGVPPLLAAAQACAAPPDAILGFRGKDAVILESDFEKACRTVEIATDDGSYGQHGLVTDLLRRRLAQPCSLICACGPTPMLKAVAALADQAGVVCQVSLEERMGCGIGACVSCVCKVNGGADVRHVQVCRYGPVIDAKEVVW